MKHKFLFIFILIFSLAIIFFPTLCFSKYIIENTALIATIDIVGPKPDIQLINITNTNVGYEKYANKTHTITARIKITGNNLDTSKLTQDNINIYVDDTIIKPDFKYISLISQTNYEQIYDICFTNVIGNGTLKINLPAGIISDISRKN